MHSFLIALCFIAGAAVGSPFGALLARWVWNRTHKQENSDDGL